MVVSKIPVYLNSFFSFFDNSAYHPGMHITKLTAVTLIKYQNNMLIPNRMHRIFCDEDVQFLNGCNDDTRSGVFQLFLQNSSAFIPVGSSFFKAIIFPDCLIVQVFAVNHKKDLFNIGKIARKLRSFERSQCLTAASSVPDISTSFNSSSFLIIGGCFNTV